MTGHRDDVLAGGIPALEDAGQYERADAPPDGTAWDLARSQAPAAITLPDRVRDTILRRHARGRDRRRRHPGTAALPGAAGFPPGWDADAVTAAVLAAARDPDRITRDDPAALPCTGPGEAPAWRAERRTGDVTIIVALRADGEITSAWPGSAAAGPAGAAEPGPLPAIIMHLTAICRARQDRGLTASVQAPAPGRYIITISSATRELTLTFAWQHRRWDLADTQLTVDGEPQDIARSVYEVIRMLSDHDIGTGTPSRIRSGARLPRDTALETKKNTVVRV